MTRLAAMLPPEYRGVYAGAVEEPEEKKQLAVSGPAR
jgi:hypothetical protein